MPDGLALSHIAKYVARSVFKVGEKDVVPIYAILNGAEAERTQCTASSVPSASSLAMRSETSQKWHRVVVRLLRRNAACVTLQQSWHRRQTKRASLVFDALLKDLISETVCGVLTAQQHLLREIATTCSAGGANLFRLCGR